MLSGKKILIIGSYYFENLGDPLFMLTTKKILEERYNASVDIADLFGRKKIDTSASSAVEKNKVSKAKKLVKKLLRAPYTIYTKLVRKKKLEKLYENMIIGYDAVVIPGGGFISFSRTFPYHNNIYALEKMCKKHNIDFCMNAVGVCRDVDALFHKKIWKKILNHKSLKYISCRDGKELIEQVGGYSVEQVSCTAVSAGDFFKIYHNKSSETIGIGVIRGNAFSSYGYDLSEEKLIDFYVELGKSLQSLGYKIKYFTNGLMTDYVIGQRVVAKLNDETLLMRRAETPEELIKQISEFKAVAVARLHAAITAFSLDVPTVLFCWGVKGQDFMRMTNAAEYMVTAENMNVEYVINRIVSVISNGWDQEQRKKVQDYAEKSILAMCTAISNK